MGKNLYNENKQLLLEDKLGAYLKNAKKPVVVWRNFGVPPILRKGIRKMFPAGGGEKNG